MDGGTSKIAGGSPRLAVIAGFRHESQLEAGSQRFLSCAIAHALACGRRTPSDLLRHFPPSALMRGLEHNAELRALILVSTTGIRERIALRKTWEEAAADLRLAFDEGEATAEAIVELFPPDALVSHLDGQKLWRFLSEGEFWSTNLTAENDTVASALQGHVAYLLDTALEEELIDQRDVVEGLSVPTLASCLPREHVAELIRRALDNGSRRRNFTTLDLVECTPPAVLVKHVPLAELWNSLIRPRIVRRHGLEASPEHQARLSLLPPAPPVDSVAPLAEADVEEITNVLPMTTLSSMVNAAHR